MDPLEALQKYIAKEVPFQEVKYNGETYYAFGDNAYPKSTVTGIPIYQKNDYYTLGSLLYFHQSLSLSHGVYVKEAALVDVQAITRIDRKVVLEYFEGKRVLPPSAQLIPSHPPVSLRSILSSEPESKRPRLDDELIEEENRKQTAAQIEVRALNENLTVDKIAEMRRKRQMHQKKNIVTIDENAASGSSLGSLKEMPTVRVHKSRENVMLGNTNLSGILDIVISAQRQWDVNEKKEKVAAIHASTAHTNRESHSSQQQQQQQQQQRTGYSRYAQEALSHDKSHEIQTEMSFIGSNLNALKSGAGVTKQADPSPMRTQNKPNTPLTTPGGKRPSRTPIIVVPAALGTMINMYNARDILQTLSFIPSDKRRLETNKKPTDLVIQRQKNGQTFNVRIIDNVDRLGNEDWDRIIGVFVMGVAWQFKGWKWNGNPTDIFTHIPAFHLYFDNDKPAEQVRNWNVHKIAVSVQKRHMDKARFGQIWETIDNFVKKNKPHLSSRLGL